MHLHVYCCAIYNSQDMETTWVCINGWMDKEVVVYTDIYTHTCGCGMYTQWNIIKPLKRMKSCYLLILEGIMLSEVSPKNKDKYYMISLICGILKNKKQNPSS